eukprot:scaffold265015_cov33-Attheya_sp.AAC.3
MDAVGARGPLYAVPRINLYQVRTSAGKNLKFRTNQNKKEGGKHTWEKAEKNGRCTRVADDCDD